MSSLNSLLTVSTSPKSLSIHESSISIIEDLQSLVPYLQDTSHINLFSNILSKLSTLFTSFKQVEQQAKSSINPLKLNPSLPNQPKADPIKSTQSKQRFRLSSAKLHKSLDLRAKEKKLQESRILKKMKTYQRRWQGNLDKLQEIVSKRAEFSPALIKKFGFIANEQLISVLGPESKGLASRTNEFLHSKNPSNDSVEFERCMAELDKNQSFRPDDPCEISIEKSFGGWKSEFDSECESSFAANHEEVRSAIQVLEKAELLQPKYLNRLGNILDLLAEEGRFENIEQVLNCIEMKNQFNSTKPPLPRYLNRTQGSIEELSLTASRDIDCFDINLGLTSTIQSKYLVESQDSRGLDLWKRDLLEVENLKCFVKELDLQECLSAEKESSCKIDSQVTECTLQGKVLAEALGGESCYSFSLNL